MMRSGWCSALCGLAGLVAAAVSAQSFPVTSIDPVSGEFPGGRGPDQMIVYSARYGEPTTGTNEWGSEAVVENCVVVSVGTNDTAIPAGGFVISGHGAARDWINQNLAPGTPVKVGSDAVQISDTLLSELSSLRFRFQAVNVRLTEFPTGGALRSQAITYRNETDRALRELVAMDPSAETEGSALEQRAGELAANLERLEAQVWTMELEQMESPVGEIRAVWHRVAERTPGEITALVDGLAAAHINVFLPETIYGSQAIFHDATGLFPLFERYGGHDALAQIIEECHARGIEVHAWIHCFYIGIRGNSDEPPLLAERHPEWLARDRQGRLESEDEPGYMFLNPAHAEARRALIEAYVALIERYDLDGLQLDYIRYPNHQAWERQWDLSDHTRALVRDELGFDPLEISPDNAEEWSAWLAWREGVITSFVEEAAAALRAVDPDIRITSAVFPDLPSAIERKGQNWAAWQRRGLMSAIMPMAYTSDPRDVSTAAEELHAVVGAEAPTVIGLGPYLGLSPRQLIDQIAAARRAGATGQALFCWDRLTPEARAALAAGPWRSGGSAVWPESAR